MSDDLDNRGPADRSRINVHERWELEWWTKTLGVSEHTLRNAITAVGANVDAVRQHLDKSTLR